MLTLYKISTNKCSTKDLDQSVFIDNSKILEKFYNVKEERYAYNSKGIDVTANFIMRTDRLYKARKYQEIKSIMAEEEISLHVNESAVKMNVDFYDVSNVSPQADNKKKRVTSEYISKVIFDTNKATTLEYQVELAGVITYNPNTDEVKAASGAQLYVHEMTSSALGAIERHYADKTSSSVRNGKGYFQASTHFAAQKEQDGVTFLYDYGVQNFSFYAVP